jgi:hypothetical protein
MVANGHCRRSFEGRGSLLVYDIPYTSVIRKTVKIFSVYHSRRGLNYNGCGDKYSVKLC